MGRHKKQEAKQKKEREARRVARREAGPLNERVQLNEAMFAPIVHDGGYIIDELAQRPFSDQDRAMHAQSLRPEIASMIRWGDAPRVDAPEPVPYSEPSPFGFRHGSLERALRREQQEFNRTDEDRRNRIVAAAAAGVAAAVGFPAEEKEEALTYLLRETNRIYRRRSSLGEPPGLDNPLFGMDTDAFFKSWEDRTSRPVADAAPGVISLLLHTEMQFRIARPIEWRGYPGYHPFTYEIVNRGVAEFSMDDLEAKRIAHRLPPVSTEKLRFFMRVVEVRLKD